MNQKTLNKLEYNKIIELLAQQATCPGGERACRALKPSADLTAIETAQAETEAAFSRIVRKGKLSLSGCYPVSDSLKRLEIGGTLGAGELLRICKLLSAANRAKSYGRHETTDDLADCLDPYFEQIEPLTVLSSEIERASSARRRSATMQALP